MGSLAAIALLVSAAALEVGLAPDQPLPFVYVDDPLIVEIRSDVDANAAVRVEVDSNATGQRVEREVTDVPMRAGGARWLAFPDLPRERGYYEVMVRVAVGDVTTSAKTGFCRIDRPISVNPEDAAAQGPALPIIARHVTRDRRVLLALLGIGVETIQIEGMGDGESDACADAEHLGFTLVVEANLNGGKDVAERVRTLHTACPDAAAWVLHGAAAPQGVLEAAQELREAGVTAPVLGVASSAESGVALIEADDQRVLRGLCTPCEGFASALPVMRDAAEARGYEAWIFHAAQTGAPRLDDAAAVRLLRDCFKALASGATGLVFDDAWIYDGAAGPWMAYCGALSRRMKAHRFAGDIDLGNGETASLFREGAVWFLPLWTEGAERQVTLPLQGAQDLVWTDALNNPLPPPTVENPTVAVTARPRYLTGRGGELLTAAALHQVGDLAMSFAENARYQRYLPEALNKLVEAIGEIPESGTARNRFFQLIRYFPEIENEWHSGTLPRTIAAPAIAHIARLARPLCVVEEAGAQPFLEPMHDTLLNCEEYQSLYLTNSVGTSLASERGDWLLREVVRLTEEARSLAQENRPIEAGAVATLAEWRARALEYAAKAGPLSDAAQELPVEVVVQAKANPGETETPVPGEPEGEAAGEVASAGTASPEPEPPAVPDSTDADADAASEPPIVLAQESPARPVPPQDARVDTATAPGQPAGTRLITHSVKSGDVPGGIAKKYGVSLDDLLAWNGLKKDAVIHIGDQLKLYVPGEEPATTGETASATSAGPLKPGQPAGTREVVHVVKRGDNPDAIARTYGVALDDFLKWNKLSRRSVINVGEKLVVYVAADRQ